MCRVLRSGEKGGHRAVGKRASKGPASFSVLHHQHTVICGDRLRFGKRSDLRKLTMHTNSKIALAVVAGAALGAAAMQGLHAQDKLKAYSVGEVELLNPEGTTFLTAAREAITAAHGRSLRTVAGRVVPIEGEAPPQHLALIEWESLDDAVAFYKSKAWADLAPERDKFEKVIRRYVVEVGK
jgi:uncharacterized protein (DUF1330 family)